MVVTNAKVERVSDELFAAVVVGKSAQNKFISEVI